MYSIAPSTVLQDTDPHSTSMDQMNKIQTPTIMNSILDIVSDYDQPTYITPIILISRLSYLLLTWYSAERPTQSPSPYSIVANMAADPRKLFPRDRRALQHFYSCFRSIPWLWAIINITLQSTSFRIELHICRTTSTVFDVLRGLCIMIWFQPLGRRQLSSRSL
jgi:hypothetical protein